VTENVTDAAKTVSEFHNDIHNLPTKIIQQVFEASLGGFPFDCASVVIFFVFWCVSFAALDTWGPFRTKGSVIASLGMAIGKGFLKTTLIIHWQLAASTYLALATPQIVNAPAFNILGIVAITAAAASVCKLWYERQKTSDKSTSDTIDQDPKYSASLSHTASDMGPLLPWAFRLRTTHPFVIANTALLTTGPSYRFALARLQNNHSWCDHELTTSGANIWRIYLALSLFLLNIFSQHLYSDATSSLSASWSGRFLQDIC
jgi:hypothetical protein